MFLFFFFFNDTATTEIYTLSLHDALPILSRRSRCCRGPVPWSAPGGRAASSCTSIPICHPARSEEHTSELQSLRHLVCRLLLEKKKRLSEFQEQPSKHEHSCCPAVRGWDT